MSAKKGLGKGLDALFADNFLDLEQDSNAETTLRVSQISPVSISTRPRWSSWPPPLRSTD